MSAGRIFIIGATSAIASAYARRAASNGASMVLAARNSDACRALADDLLVRGAAVAEIEHFDAQDFPSHDAIVGRAWETLGEVNVVLVAHGSLPDQRAAEASSELACQHISINATGSASIIGSIANRLAQQGHGSLVVISSVAGDRGRQSNYIYGASKSFLNTLLEGLRHRLHSKSVHVMTVKPGFVDTPMTDSFEKGPLWASPEKIARDMEKGIRRRRSVIYTPWFWRWIMVLIRILPARLIYQTKL